MQLISHRGLAHAAQENTLAAFACALAAGFQGIETDVRVSADGELVLLHDRSTPGGQPVAALTRSELSQELGFLVPTLPEALEAFPDALWNIEIKTPAAAPATFALLEKLGSRRHILLTSFRHELIVQATQTLEVECGLLFAHHPAFLKDMLCPILPLPRLRTLVWHYEALDPLLLQQAGTLGFHNWVYGAQTDHEHRLCSEFGLDGIISNYPEFVGLTPPSSLQ